MVSTLPCLAFLFTQEHGRSRTISLRSHVFKIALPASSCMEWAEWWGRYLNNLTSGKGRYPANSGITSMWTLWVAWAATGIDITPELFPQTAQLLLLSTTARTKRRHYKNLTWKKRTSSIEHFEISIFAVSKNSQDFLCEVGWGPGQSDVVGCTSGVKLYGFKVPSKPSHSVIL